MKRMTIWVRHDIQNELKNLSNRTGASVTALVRFAIEDYLRDCREPAGSDFANAARTQSDYALNEHPQSAGPALTASTK